MFSGSRIPPSAVGGKDQIEALGQALEAADAVIIGAGAGLSASAGLTYDGERFERYFSDFQAKYGIRDMYSGGFYPFDSLEEYWAWWSRQILHNRYERAPRPVYADLLALVGERDYFVLTTNVDHQFQLAGFDKKRLFYTQGDYGLWQCSQPCHQATYDNEEAVRRMAEEQRGMRVPSELLPRCPRCGPPHDPEPAGRRHLRPGRRVVRRGGAVSGVFAPPRGPGRAVSGAGVGMNTPVFCSLRTRKKSRKITVKRQITEGSHINSTGEYEERRCA